MTGTSNLAAKLASVAPDPAGGGALSGVRVIDMSRLVAGNMLSLQLADFGADVVKVESPKNGDTLRHWVEDVPDAEALDAWWRIYGRNKRSLSLDLRDGAALSALRKLLSSAQVLIESFRPGTLESMGLGPESLFDINPALVIVRVSGWGQTGPYRNLPGFGSLIEGFSGYACKHVTADGVPQLPNMAFADMVSGLTGAFATLVALRQVEVNGGKGQVVDLSLLEPTLAIMGPDVAAYAATGQVRDPARKIASPRNAYRCKDGGWVAMSGSTDTMAHRVMEAIGRSELAEDPRFATNDARLANDAALDKLVADAIASMDTDECLALFRSKGVTVGPIYDAARLLEDEHVVKRECYVALQDDRNTVMHNVTPRLSDTPGTIRRPAPAIGEHTVELLREAGLSFLEIAEMNKRGTIRCA